VELRLEVLGFLIFSAVAASELIRLAIRYFFGKLTRNDYVTKTECKNCQAKGWGDAIDELKTGFAEIRGILLILAVKAGIPAEQLRDLTK
jgi:hypothetical protein